MLAAIKINFGGVCTEIVLQADDYDKQDLMLPAIAGLLIACHSCMSPSRFDAACSAMRTWRKVVDGAHKSNSLGTPQIQRRQHQASNALKQKQKQGSKPPKLHSVSESLDSESEEEHPASASASGSAHTQNLLRPLPVQPAEVQPPQLNLLRPLPAQPAEVQPPQLPETPSCNSGVGAQTKSTHITRYAESAEDRDVDGSADPLDGGHPMMVTRSVVMTKSGKAAQSPALDTGPVVGRSFLSRLLPWRSRTTVETIAPKKSGSRQQAHRQSGSGCLLQPDPRGIVIPASPLLPRAVD